MLVFVMLFVLLFALSAFAASFTYGPKRLITDADVAVNENGEKMYEMLGDTTATTGGWGQYYTSVPSNVLDGDHTTRWSCSTNGTIRITFANEWEITGLKGLFYSNGKSVAVTAFDKDGNQIAQYYANNMAAGDGYHWVPSSGDANFDMSSSFAKLEYGENAVKYIELYHATNWNNMSPKTFELYIEGRERIPSTGCEVHTWAEELDPAPTCTEVGTLYRWCEVCMSEDAPKEVPALGHIIGNDPETYEITKDPDCQQVGEISFTCQREGCSDTIVRSLTLDDVTDYADMYSAKNAGAGGNTTQQDIPNQLFDGNMNSILQASSSWYIQSEITLDMPYYISSITVWTGYDTPNGANSEFNLTLYYKAPGETEWTVATEAKVAPTDLNAWAKTMHIVEFEEVQASAIMIKITEVDDYSGFAAEAKIRGSVIANAGGDHIWGEPEVVEPSCDHTGYTKTTCTVCGESKTSDPQPAIEHLWDIPATCTTGTTCSVCKNSKNDALGHTEVDIPAVEATCTEAGKTAGKECTVCHEITVEPEEIEIDPNNHVNAEMNSAYTVSSCPDCGDVSFYNSHMGIDNDYTFYFMGNLVNIYKEGMDEFYAYTKVIDAETGVATLVLSEAFDEETEASRGTTFVGFVASVSVNKDDSLYISLAKDDVTYLFGTDPETIVDNSSALNGTYQYVENNVVIFEFVLEDGKITWTIAGGEENGAEATYTFYGSKFTTAFPLEYVSGWMGDFLLYSRYNPMTGETEEYPLTLKSDEEPEDPEIPEVNYGIEIDPITVVTTDTYNFIDNYTYTALTSGKYTFYFPAGLGLLLPDNYMPVIDFYDNENGQYYTVALAEGQTFEFVVGATVKDTWTISVYYEYAEVEAPEESEGAELVIGKTDINGEDATYIFTATENGVLTLTTQAAIMGEVTIVYSVNGGEAQSVALSSSVAINLVAGDEVVITVTAAGYSAFTAAWEKTIPVKDLIVNESSNQVEMSDVIFVYTAPEAGKLTLTTGAAIMGEVVFTYTINGSEALEFALQSTVELPLEAGDYVKVTVIAAGYSSLTATWEADHTHSYSETVTDPTCTDKGYTTYTCTCGDTYVGNYVDATGHKYTETKVESTCTVAGKITYTCACGDSYEETLKLAPHTEVKIPAVPSTSKTTGKTSGFKCSVCDTVTVAPKDAVTGFKVNASLSLGEDISMYINVLIPTANGLLVEGSYVVAEFPEITLVDTLQTITESKYDASTGRYKFKFTSTKAQFMTDIMTFTAYACDENGIESAYNVPSYSMVQYIVGLYKAAKADNDTKQVTLLSDLLELGSATQIFMGYKADTLVTAVAEDMLGYDIAPSTFVTPTKSVAKVDRDGKDISLVDFRTFGLRLGNVMKPTLYFDDKGDLTGYTVKVFVDGVEQETVYGDLDTLETDEKGRRILEISSGIKVLAYDKDIVAKFYDANGNETGSVITISVNSYFALNYSKNPAKEQAFMRAIYNYGASADAFFN